MNTPEENPPRKKKKKDRARESQALAPPPVLAGDPLGTRVIAATAGIVSLIGILAWATSGGPAGTDREDDRESGEIRAADEDAPPEHDREDRLDRRADREQERPSRAGVDRIHPDDQGDERTDRVAAGPGDIPAPADVAAPPTDAQRTASGLASKVLRAGDGDRHPGPSSRVTVHYTGWTTDGRMFDSSVTRGEPATFPLNGVIAGWTEGVQLMVTGERRRFWIPEQLAYRGRPGAPAGMLVFDVELISIAD